VAESHLETLRLTRARVESRVQFLVSYAATCERERDVGHAFSDGDPAAEPKGRPLTGERRWNRQLEAASSLCEGGQWAMLIDPSRAFDLWRRAGRLYREVGLGFGYFLSVITSDVDPESDEAGTLKLTVATLATEAARLAERRPRIGFIYLEGENGRRFVPAITEETQYAQQQAYWLLAAATFGGQYGDESLTPSVADLLEHSPNRYGADPVGALGIPIETVWRAADALTQPPDSGSPTLAATLGELARRYAVSIRPAMENSYLWQNGAAPVDVGSVDIAALTLSGHLVFGDVFRNALRAEMERVSDVARAQLDIALDLTSREN
jgi:hypothetical protein